MNKKQVIAWVRGALLEHEIVADIIEEGVRADEDFWYVPVTESDINGRRFEYYQLLSKVELDFSNAHPEVYLLLIPGRTS